MHPEENDRKRISLPLIFQTTKEPPNRKRAEKWAALYRDSGEELYLQRFLQDYENVLNNFVIDIAYRYNMGHHAEDLKMVIATECIKVLPKFDPEKCSLKMFIQSRTFPAVHEYIRTMRSGYLASTKSTNQLLRTIMWHYHQNGDRCDEETLKRIGKEVKRKPKNVLRYIIAGTASEGQVHYYQHNRDDDSERTLDEVIPDSGGMPEVELLKAEARDLVMLPFSELRYSKRDIVARHLGFCMQCEQPKKNLTFETLALEYNLRSAKAAENRYRQAMEQMTMQLFREGKCHIVRLKLLENTKEIVSFAYQADDDGAWGEIRYHRKVGDKKSYYQIYRLADWDLTRSKPFAKCAIRAIKKMIRTHNIRKTAVIPWREG